MNYKKMCELASFIADKEVDMATFLPETYYKASPEALALQAKKYRSRKGMDTVVHDCGTACCIGGWTALKYGKSFDISGDAHDLYENIQRFAKSELKLTNTEASMLFTPSGWNRPLDQETQRSRMMGVLRGEIALNYNWLHDPQPRKIAS